jgi:hypothetical protein
MKLRRKNKQTVKQKKNNRQLVGGGGGGGKYLNSPVRELHSYLPITKRVHYYYANQAK